MRLFPTPMLGGAVTRAATQPPAQLRQTHCDCPGVESAIKGPGLVITYDPQQVDRFIECADAIEAAYPQLIVEGGACRVLLARAQASRPLCTRGRGDYPFAVLDMQRSGVVAVEGAQGQFDVANPAGEVLYRPVSQGSWPEPAALVAILSKRLDSP